MREIIKAFREKAGAPATALTRIDAAEDPQAVLAVGRTASLFSEKELIVLERASRTPAEVTAHLTREIGRWAKDSDITFVFWEEELPAKSPLAAVLMAHAEKAQEFKPLAPAAAMRWLEAEAARRGLKLPAEEKRLLLRVHGSDLWALVSELEKIRDGWSLRTMERTATEVWDFTDAFLRHRRSAYAPLARLLAGGFDAVYLLASLGGALRTAALVWKGVQSGTLESLAGRLHPFAVRKNIELTRSLDAASLGRRFGELIRADTELKIGRLPSSLTLVKLVLERKSKSAA